MSRIQIRSLGRTAIEVDIRGHRFTLDQGADSGGSDLGPTPTELFCAALAACSIHYARAFLAHHGGQGDPVVSADCDFEFSPDGHRVGEVDITLELPEGLSEARLAAALRAASHCTVHNSLATPPLIRYQYSQKAPSPA